MPKIKINNKKELSTESKTWSKPVTINMSDFDRETYESRKKAVDLYLSDEPLNKIEQSTGIKTSHICEFVEKCSVLDSSGVPLGYVALIPCLRTKRKIGLFSKLMNDYPDIKDYLLEEFFSKNRKWNKFQSYTDLHKSLLRRLHSKGLSETDYPFNTKLKGYRSMVTFLEDTSNLHPYDAMNRYGKEAKQLFKSTYFMQPIQSASKRPFARVEIDGHKVDALFTVKVTNEYGDTVQGLAKRIWIIAAIDVATRVILGYTISVNENYNRFDVLECINNSIVPHEQFTFQRFNVLEKIEGFHSIAVPGTQWAIMDEIALDNALAHLSKDVINNLENLGISINFGPVATPNKRPIVERFFKTLEEKGFHRIPSTTGSNPRDVKRAEPEKGAISYAITLQEIYEIAEVVISEYNTQPHDSLSGFSPISLLMQRFDRGFLPSAFVPLDERKEFSVVKIYQIRKVQGNKKKGIRPYVSFEGHRYSGHVMSSNYLLVGDHVTLEIDPLDIRTLKVYLDNGAPIGDVSIKGKNIATAISMKNNTILRKFIHENKIKFDNVEDVIEDFTIDLEEKAIYNKTAATRLASMRNDAEKRSPDSLILPRNKSVPEKNMDRGQLDDSIEKKLLSDEELREKWTDPSKRTW
ncbi:transposase [Acetobacterium bakii]|nr:transposase [Acetobacterium bakii]